MNFLHHTLHVWAYRDGWWTWWCMTMMAYYKRAYIYTLRDNVRMLVFNGHNNMLYISRS